MFKLSTLLLPALLLAGCSQYREPIDVAENFWQAVQNKNVNKLNKTLTAESRARNESMDNILPIGKVELGKTVIDGGQAWVDTSVEVLADKPFTLPLKTVLEKENKIWKVNYKATVSNISEGSEVAKFIGSMRNLSDQFAKQLGGALNELQNTIPEVERELRKLEQNIKSQIPELKERLEEFSEELDEALKQPPQQPGDTIEI